MAAGYMERRRRAAKASLTKEAAKHGAYTLDMIRRALTPWAKEWTGPVVDTQLTSIAYRARLAFRAAAARLDADQAAG